MSSTVISRAPNQGRSQLPTELPPNAGRAATGIFIVLLAQLMLVLDATVVNVALPRIATDLDFGPASLSWVLNGYALAFGGLLLLGGRLGDVFGRRRMFVGGVITFTVFSLLGGLAPTAGLLVAARAGQGIGAAIAAPSVLALLMTSAPDEAARNRALALFAAVSSGGGTLGLLLGGLLTDVGSWRWTLFINVPIGVAVVATVGRFVTETPRRPGRFDVVGAVTATGAAVSIVWALIGAPDHGWTSTRTLGFLALGLVLLGVLAATETRVAHPLLRPHLLRNRRRVAGLVIMAGMFAAQMSMFYLLVQYLQRELGFGPMASGVAFLPLTVGIFAMSRVTPRILAAIGPVAMLVIGTTGMTASFLWLSLLDSSSTYAAGIFGAMLLNGVTAALCFLGVQVTVLGGVEPEHAGAASGLLQTAQQLGGAVGLAVIASVYAANAVAGQFLPGLDQAFIASAALSGTALLAALTLVVRRPSLVPTAELD